MMSRPLLTLSAAVGAVVLVLALKHRKESVAAVSKPNGGSNDPPAPKFAPVVRQPLAALPPLRNDLLLRAARRQTVEKIPVWVMRQAGRYLPEFLKLKVDTKADFFTLCRTPEYASELTLQPLRRYKEKLDAVIIFSDILIVLQAMGLEVLMAPGPIITKPVDTPADLGRLVLSGVDATQSFSYLLDAINLTRQRLEGAVPLIGFVGGPWTLMTYAIEKQGAKTYEKSKKWLYQYPEASHKLLAAITTILIDLLVAQYEAGAQLLQVFESHSGELCPADFREFLLPYLNTVATQVKAKISAKYPGQLLPPLTIFARNSHYAIADLAESDYDVIGLDWSVDPAVAASIVAGRKCLQGNLDPCTLFAPTETLVARTTAMLQGFSGQSLIANLGHGMMPSHTPEQLQTYLDTVYNWKL